MMRHSYFAQKFIDALRYFEFSRKLDRLSEATHERGHGVEVAGRVLLEVASSLNVDLNPIADLIDGGKWSDDQIVAARRCAAIIRALPAGAMQSPTKADLAAESHTGGSRAELNILARKIIAESKGNVSMRDLARLLKCSKATVGRLPAWKAVQAGNQKLKPGGTRGRGIVSFRPQLHQTHESKREKLDELIRDQSRDDKSDHVRPDER